MATSKPALTTNEDGIERYNVHDAIPLSSEKTDIREAHEVFQKSVDGVEFRTVSW